jgi:Flp pilus assembly protein TadG
MMAIGLGVDYARLALVKTELQKSLDAGALAAARYLETVTGADSVSQARRDADAAKDASDYFWANFRVAAAGDVTVDPGPTLAIEAGERRFLTTKATAHVTLNFGGLLGMPTTTVSASSKVERYTRGMEIVLALDTSKSMDSNHRIDALRDGALDLIDILYGARNRDAVVKQWDCRWVDSIASLSGRIKKCDQRDSALYIGIVPFAGTVNLSPGAASINGLIDTRSIPPRSDYGLDLRGRQANFWKGCVRAREDDLEGARADVLPGAVADSAFRAYYWKPSPETVDVDGVLRRGSNYWVRERIPAVIDPVSGDTIKPAVPVTVEQWPLLTGTNQPSMTPFATTFFNTDQTIGVGWGDGAEAGPNRGCTYPLMPLQPSGRVARSIVRGLEPSAGNGTLINLGMAWSWRLLSPDWRPIWSQHHFRSWDWASGTFGMPFDPFWFISWTELDWQQLQARPVEYRSRQYDKVVVLFTDGKNEIGNGGDGIEGSSVNSCCFSAYGSWWSDVRSGSLQPRPTVRIDELTVDICRAMKAKGIKIYVVHLYNRPPEALRRVLDDRGCATGPEYYHNISDPKDLRAIFRQIGAALTNLRLTREDS